MTDNDDPPDLHPTMAFEFVCTSCGDVHHGMPAFSARAPLDYYAVPESERGSRCELDTDFCIIDDKFYYVRGCIEIPVHGEDEPFSWGVWISLSAASFAQWQESFHLRKRSHVGPFFGWLNASLSPYADTMDLKTRAHLRDEGVRPLIELEPTDHPLAVEQRTGISVERVKYLYAHVMHGSDT